MPAPLFGLLKMELFGRFSISIDGPPTRLITLTIRDNALRLNFPA
jgi:hypothetical protein